MDEIKVGDYIYDISIVKGVYQANQYKVLYIDDVYIYCINNDKVKGRFNKSDSVLYKNINEAIHRTKILNIDEKQRQKKLRIEEKEKIKTLNRLKNSFYEHLGNRKKSIYNHIETDLESQVRNSQIQEIKNRASKSSSKPNYSIPKKSTKQYPYNYGRDWRYDSPKLVKPREKKIRPSVPYKILPNGAIVSINKNDRD